MEDTKLWTKFKKTGCIADYLAYKGAVMQPENEKAGEKAFESVDCSNRNDTVRDTYR